MDNTQSWTKAIFLVQRSAQVYNISKQDPSQFYVFWKVNVSKYSKYLRICLWKSLRCYSLISRPSGNSQTPFCTTAIFHVVISACSSVLQVLCWNLGRWDKLLMETEASCHQESVSIRPFKLCFYIFHCSLHRSDLINVIFK